MNYSPQDLPDVDPMSESKLTYLPGSFQCYKISGPVQPSCTITATPTTISFGQIVVPAGLRGIIDYATLELYIGLIKNNYATTDNNIASDQYIQMKVGAASYSNAILIPSGTMLSNAGNQKTWSYIFPGSIDVSSLFTKGSTIDVQWTSAAAAQISIGLYNYVLTLNIYTRL